MAAEEGYCYGVHLAKCSAINCACPYVEERLHDGLNRLGVSTVLGRSVYSKAGSRSAEFLKYAGQSLFTVVPACQHADASFQDCLSKAPKNISAQFVVVLSEPIGIPLFLTDFNCIPLYNVKETTEYNSLMEWFDKKVTPSLRGTRTRAAPVVPTPEPDDGLSNPHVQRHPRSRPPSGRRMTPLSVGFNVENDSTDDSSGSISTLGTEGETAFVSLPSLKPLDHPDSGPTARQYCTEIDDQHMIEFRKGLQEDFHTLFNSCDTAEKKRDAVLYALQTFNKRTLNFPLSYAVQLLYCNHENVRLHGLSYIECKLLRWDVYVKRGEFKDLITLEEGLFQLLADPGPTEYFVVPQFSQIAGLYMLCLALVRDHFYRDKTEQYKNFKGILKERQFQIDEGNDRNYYYKALETVLRETLERGNKGGGVASILQFKTALTDFHKNHTQSSLQELTNIIQRIPRPTSVYRLRHRETRKVERMLTYQVIVRVIVSSLKDKCGRASASAYGSHEIETHYNKSLMGLLKLFSTQGIRGMPAVWQEQFKRELRPLLFHENVDIAQPVRHIVKYLDMSTEEREHLLLGHFSELFSAVGLQWTSACVGERSQTERCGHWKHYIGKIGGSRKPLVASADVSIIFNDNPHRAEGLAMSNDGLDGLRKRRTECEILGHLGESSSILQLYAVDSSPGQFVYVLEMSPDGSLQKFLLDRRRDRNWLSLQELIDIAIQVISAIEYCHRKQVIHRDIRTENFHYSKADRTVKLNNFGMASHFQGADVTDVDVEEIAALWSSPETLKDKTTSTSSDIWMLGQTLYELFMHGSWPYSSRLRNNYSYEKIVYWIAHQGIKPFESSGCIPPEICRPILSCMEMEESKRPTATSLRIHFEEMKSEFYHDSEMQVPPVQSKRPSYPPLCKFQVDQASKAIKGIPPKLADPASHDSMDEHFVPDHWETDFIEDDDPDISNLTDKMVTHERPLYQHTLEEKKVLSGQVPGLVQLKAYTTQQDEITMTSEWSCPNPLYLSKYVTRAVDRDDSFIDNVIQIFSEVTKTLTELHRNRCIHRDICAKHILVNPQSGHACLYRIARVKHIKRNFSSHDESFVEDQSTHEKFSKRVRWFPVEVLQDRCYSFKADVYMLAVTIWEVFHIISRVRQRRSLTLPFSNISKDKLSGHLAKGGILPSPGDCCPGWLYDVMKECWSTSPAARPTMAHVNMCLEQRTYIPSFEFQRRPCLNKNRKSSFSPHGDTDTVWFAGEDTVPKRPYTEDFTNCSTLWVNSPCNPFTNIPRQRSNKVAKTLSQVPGTQGREHTYEQLLQDDVSARSDEPEYDDISY